MGRHGGQAPPQENPAASREINPFNEAKILAVPLKDTNFLMQLDSEVVEPMALVNGDQITLLPVGMLLHDGPSEITPSLATSGNGIDQTSEPQVVGYVRHNGAPYLFTEKDRNENGDQIKLPRDVVKRMRDLLEPTGDQSDNNESDAGSDAPESFVSSERLSGIITQHAADMKVFQETLRLQAIVQESAAHGDALAADAAKGILARAAVIAARRNRQQNHDV